MLISLPSVLAATLAFAASSVQARSVGSLQARQYQDPNSPLLVDYPSCGFYKCIVTWTHGEKTYINWSNAPKGDVQLDLMTNDNNDVAYPIANTTSPSPSTECDSGEGEGVPVDGKACGRFSFIVPTEWTPGRNYSVRAFLQSDRSIESYTDVVQIQPAQGNPEPSIAFSSGPNAGASATSTASSASSSATSAAKNSSSTSAASQTSSSGATAPSAAPSNAASAQLQAAASTTIAMMGASIIVVALVVLGA